MELSSEEGTTQGCPLSMAMYALSAVELINKCQSVLSTEGLPRSVQIWYADDAAAGILREYRIIFFSKAHLTSPAMVLLSSGKVLLMNSWKLILAA